jgi:hypothetical protein
MTDGMTAAINAVVAHLRSTLSLNDTDCDAQPEGQPPPNSGKIYYAVHQGDWKIHEEGSDNSLDEIYGVKVTITLRAGGVPTDRLDAEIYTQARLQAAKVRSAIHVDYTLFNAINALLDAGEQPFNEPLRFRVIEGPTKKKPDWFYSDQKESKAVSGVAITVVFSGLRRTQDISTQV